MRLRKELTEQGLDAGADTIGWHLTHHHQVTVSRATINRALAAAGTVTHYRLTNPDGSPGRDVEIITWLDDHSRYALHISAHLRITGTIVVDTFTTTAQQHGYPASTLTDNGMVYTTRFSGGAGGKGSRNGLETLLHRHHIVQKNSRPNHPTTCGKVERFQQTFKKWLRAQPVQPDTIEALQALLDRFSVIYNEQRPHRSLPHRATPTTLYNARPKATPSTDRSAETHNRVRTDRVDTSGVVTLRVNGRLHHIGIGRTHARTHARTHVLLLVHDLDVRVINAATGELLRELTIDPRKDYQPTGRPPGPTPKKQ